MFCRVYNICSYIFCIFRAAKRSRNTHNIFLYDLTISGTAELMELLKYAQNLSIMCPTCDEILSPESDDPEGLPPSPLLHQRLPESHYRSRENLSAGFLSSPLLRLANLEKYKGTEMSKILSLFIWLLYLLRYVSLSHKFTSR